MPPGFSKTLIFNRKHIRWFFFNIVRLSMETYLSNPVSIFWLDFLKTFQFHEKTFKIRKMYPPPPTTERAETTIVEKTRGAAKKARYVDEDSDQVIKETHC